MQTLEMKAGSLGEIRERSEPRKELTHNRRDMDEDWRKQASFRGLHETRLAPNHCQIANTHPQFHPHRSNPVLIAPKIPFCLNKVFNTEAKG
jgi:hypothetical protein